MTRVGSLCTGYGGLDMAVQAVLGGELAWVCDIDAGAGALLAHNHPDLPNLHDLTATDWATVEPVDVMTAGWPCQPWSQAGKRKGAEDERAIWPEVAGAVRHLRPALVVLENVSAIAGAGELARAVGDLAQIGYDACWGSLRASAVGAPHRRERIFIAAADTAGAGWGLGEPVDVNKDGVPADVHPGQAEPGRRDSAAAYADEQGPQGCVGEKEPHPLGRLDQRRSVQEQPTAQRGDAPADTDGRGLAGQPRRDSGTVEPEGLDEPQRLDADGRVLDWGGYRPAIRRWEGVLGRPAPAPTVLGKRGGRQLAAPFVEWLMGLPEGWVCDVPGLTRNQQLKLLGNGVIPQQAEAALRLLLPRLVSTEAVAA